MQRIKLGISALAASATILAPAGSVAASTQSAPSQTTMTTTAAADCVLLCRFDLYEDGRRVGHDVDTLTAVKFCWGGILPPPSIETFAIGQKIACYPYQGHQRWIIRTK